MLWRKQQFPSGWNVLLREEKVSLTERERAQDGQQQAELKKTLQKFVKLYVEIRLRTYQPRTRVSPALPAQVTQVTTLAVPSYTQVFSSDRQKTTSHVACGPRTTLKRCPMRSDGGLPRKSPPPVATHSLRGPIARRFRWTQPAASCNTETVLRKEKPWWRFSFVTLPTCNAFT